MELARPRSGGALPRFTHLEAAAAARRRRSRWVLGGFGGAGKGKDLMVQAPAYRGEEEDDAKEAVAIAVVDGC